MPAMAGGGVHPIAVEPEGVATIARSRVCGTSRPVPESMGDMPISAVAATSGHRIARVGFLKAEGPICACLGLRGRNGSTANWYDWGHRGLLHVPRELRHAVREHGDHPVLPTAALAAASKRAGYSACCCLPVARFVCLINCGLGRLRAGGSSNRAVRRCACYIRSAPYAKRPSLALQNESELWKGFRYEG